MLARRIIRSALQQFSIMATCAHKPYYDSDVGVVSYQVMQSQQEAKGAAMCAHYAGLSQKIHELKSREDFDKLRLCKTYGTLVSSILSQHASQTPMP
jgi:hypothetical protein